MIKSRQALSPLLIRKQQRYARAPSKPALSRIPFQVLRFDHNAARAPRRSAHPIQTSRRSEMSSANYSLRHAVHCVLLASAASMPAVPVFAQETDSAARPIEEVVITGSRIRRVDEETASPV